MSTGTLDTIARGLARGMSRREALRTGGAALVATVAASPADALARVTGHCSHHRVKCHGKCCPAGEVCLHPKARKHRPRPKPRCGCRPGTVRCNGTCVALRTDAHNCGKCGHKCGAGQVCTGGRCISKCPAGESVCSGACVSLATNPQHCGKCANKCAPGGVCHQGGCLNSCPSGYSPCQGGCVNLHSDTSNCGACGQVCATGAVCANGTCSSNCPSGQATCAGTCVSLATDPDNCDGCGRVCGSTQACVDGACSSSCPSGTTLCGRYCVHLQGDASNCGACGHTCAIGTVCSGGVCTGSCASGTVDCGGSCCAGSACCGSSCETQHNTGLGQNFYDCSALGVPGNPTTYGQALAREAASAAFPGASQSVVNCPDTQGVAIQVANASGFAVWSYSGPTAGYVHFAGAPYCPSTSDPTWD
jgi:Stigma-specific protein, Stig1